jgi:hypothetical protein
VSTPPVERAPALDAPDAVLLAVVVVGDHVLARYRERVGDDIATRRGVGGSCA